MRTFILAVAVAITASIFNPVDAHAATATVPSCQRLIVSDYSPQVVDELKAAGWTADPADGVEALYAPQCDPADVDTWPLGAAIDAVRYDLLPPVMDAIAETVWVLDALAAGWALLPADAITDPDGTPHAPCVALVGPTTRVLCSDGHTATS